jgi:hypothetical protein
MTSTPTWKSQPRNRKGRFGRLPRRPYRAAPNTSSGDGCPECGRPMGRLGNGPGGNDLVGCSHGRGEDAAAASETAPKKEWGW